MKQDTEPKKGCIELTLSSFLDPESDLRKQYDESFCVHQKMNLLTWADNAALEIDAVREELFKKLLLCLRETDELSNEERDAAIGICGGFLKERADLVKKLEEEKHPLIRTCKPRDAG